MMFGINIVLILIFGFLLQIHLVGFCRIYIYIFCVQTISLNINLTVALKTTVNLSPLLHRLQINSLDRNKAKHKFLFSRDI